MENLTDRLIRVGMPLGFTLSLPLIEGIKHSLNSDWQTHPYLSATSTLLSALPAGMVGLASYITLSSFENNQGENRNG